MISEGSPPSSPLAFIKLFSFSICFWSLFFRRCPTCTIEEQTEIYKGVMRLIGFYLFFVNDFVFMSPSGHTDYHDRLFFKFQTNVDKVFILVWDSFIHFLVEYSDKKINSGLISFLGLSLILDGFMSSETQLRFLEKIWEDFSSIYDE